MRFRLNSGWGLLSTAIAVLTIAVSSTLPVRAQVLYGSIVGTVEDQTGAVIPGATVVISSQVTGQIRTTTSNDAGQYSLINVLPGTYVMKVTASGFGPFTESEVSASINNVTRVNVKLEVGGVTEQVSVAGAATLLQSDTADVHMEINTKEVTDLPLANYRNYQSLIDLVPGATPGA